MENSIDEKSDVASAYHSVRPGTIKIFVSTLDAEYLFFFSILDERVRKPLLQQWISKEEIENYIDERNGVASILSSPLLSNSTVLSAAAATIFKFLFEKQLYFSYFFCKVWNFNVFY